MRIRHLCLALVPLVVATGVAASPASAGDVACPSGAALMTNADIPVWLSTNPRRTLRCEVAPRATPPYLCINAGGKDLYGLKPREHSRSTILLGGNETVSVEKTAINSIYGYANSTAGSQAWTVLRQRAAICPTSSTTTDTTPGETVTITQTTRITLLPVVMGKRGLALTQTVRVVGTGTANFTVRAATYTVFRSVGRFIVKVESNSSTRVPGTRVGVIGPVQEWTRTEAVRVAQRLTRVR